MLTSLLLATHLMLAAEWAVDSSARIVPDTRERGALAVATIGTVPRPVAVTQRRGGQRDATWRDAKRQDAIVPRLSAVADKTGRAPRLALDAAAIHERRRWFAIAGAVVGAAAACWWVERRGDRQMASAEESGLAGPVVLVGNVLGDVLVALPVGIAGGALAGVGVSFVVYSRRDQP